MVGFKAIRVQKFGGPEVLTVGARDTEELMPVKSQILVKVHAAGINPVETYMRAGTYARLPPLPWTPGKECSGIVEEIGPDVTRFKKGDRVFVYMTLSGAYSQYALVEENKTDPLPDRVTFEQGASIGTAYRTAFRALIHKAQARPGMTVFVHGASGGVGVATVQLALSYGMRVVGSAGSKEGLAMLEKMGCDGVVNHRGKDYMAEAMQMSGGRGFDVIVEMLANVNLDADLSVLSRGGVVAVVGNRGRIEVNPRDLMMKESRVVGVLGWGTADEQRESRTAILNGLRRGHLVPKVGITYSLNKCPDAHVEVIEHANATQGKVVLLPFVESKL